MFMDVLVEELESRDKGTADWARRQNFFRPNRRATNAAAALAKALLWDEARAEGGIIAVYSSPVRFMSIRSLVKLAGGVLAALFIYATTGPGYAMVGLLSRMPGTVVEAANLVLPVMAAGAKGVSAATAFVMGDGAGSEHGMTCLERRRQSTRLWHVGIGRQ